MNMHLKESVSKAEEVLPDEKLELLAQMIDELVADAGSVDKAGLSAAELAELQMLAEKPSDPVDPAQVEEIFARHGV